MVNFEPIATEYKVIAENGEISGKLIKHSGKWMLDWNSSLFIRQESVKAIYKKLKELNNA